MIRRLRFMAALCRSPPRKATNRGPRTTRERAEEQADRPPGACPPGPRTIVWEAEIEKQIDSSQDQANHASSAADHSDSENTLMPWKSIATTGSLPTTHASWPGAIWQTSPARVWNSVPSSMRTFITPDS
jgi:hypothetical protein